MAQSIFLKFKKIFFFWPHPLNSAGVFHMIWAIFQNFDMSYKLLRKFVEACPKNKKYIWCKYIVRTKIYTPYNRYHFFAVRDIKMSFWEKFSKQKFFLYCWTTFWQHFFVAATNSNKKQQMWKNWGLLLLVVATKFFYRFFLYHHVGAHLKIFWRARAVTHRKNCLNIK